MKRFILIMTAALCCLLTTPTQAQKTEELEDLSVADLMRLAAQATDEAEQARLEYEAALARQKEAQLALEESCPEDEQSESKRLDFFTFPAPTLHGPPIYSTLPSYEVHFVIDQHRGALNRCHNTGSVSRLIFITFDVNDLGRVTAFELVNKSDENNDRFEQCLRDTFEEMEFSVPNVTYYNVYRVNDYPILLE